MKLLFILRYVKINGIYRKKIVFYSIHLVQEGLLGCFWPFSYVYTTIMFYTFHYHVLKSTNVWKMSTSKTWTQTLDLDAEKPWPWKTWTLKNVYPENRGPWKTWTLKNLDPEKPLLRIKSFSVKSSKYQRQSSGGALKIFTKFIEKYQKYP